MIHGETNAKNERYCANCEGFKYPTHDLHQSGRIRPTCPKCGHAFPDAQAEKKSDPVAPAAPLAQGPTVENDTRKISTAAKSIAPVDVLAAARARLVAIDAALRDHEALLAEREQLDRMIRAAERPARRRRKKSAAILKLAT